MSLGRPESEKKYHDRVTTAEQEEMLLSSFQRLSLVIPLEPAKFSFVTSFLTRVLNLDDPNLVVGEAPPPKWGRTTEVVPNIALPPDLWLSDNIQIRNAKIKAQILSEINALMENDALNIDENTLLYYEKLLVAYRVYDIPTRSQQSSSLDFLKEEDEEKSDTSTYKNDASSHDSFKIDTHAKSDSIESQSTISASSTQTIPIQTQTLPFPSPISPSTPKRFPRKRFSLNDDDDKRSVLTKSRIYNKIKRNRESAGSLASVSSSNRNSVATTVSVASASSRRRSSEEKPAPIPLLLPVQRAENKRAKYEYYVQLHRLLMCTERVLDMSMGGRVDNAKVVRFGEFIKKKVLTFIVIDVFSMILDYGQMRAYELYGKR